MISRINGVPVLSIRRVNAIDNVLRTIDTIQGANSTIPTINFIHNPAPGVVVLIWHAVSGATKYVVEMRNVSMARFETHETHSTEHNTSSHTIGSFVEYRVRIINIFDNSGWTNWFGMIVTI